MTFQAPRSTLPRRRVRHTDAEAYMGVIIEHNGLIRQHHGLHEERLTTALTMVGFFAPEARLETFRKAWSKAATTRCMADAEKLAEEVRRESTADMSDVEIRALRNRVMARQIEALRAERPLWEFPVETPEVPVR